MLGWGSASGSPPVGSPYLHPAPRLFSSGSVGLGWNMSTEKRVADEMGENIDAVFNANFCH